MSALKFEYLNKRVGSREEISCAPEEIKYENEEWVLYGTSNGMKRAFSLNNIQRFIDGRNVQRYLCVTTYVINGRDELLMMFNKKLSKWAPPGGKVDNYETPDAAAIRECLEETGIQIQLIGIVPPVEGAMVTPIGSQCNVIKKGLRDHVDLIYAGKPLDENAKLILSEREGTDVGWFSLEKTKTLDTFESVRYWHRFVIEQLRYTEASGSSD
jgi:8-oxo-dGTP pyrophosphatase MutT (NUDIX family)